MSEIKIKVRCQCGQNIRVLATRVRTRIRCPRCSAEVLVAGPPEPAVVEIQCRCGEIVPAGVASCVGCGLGVIEEIAKLSRALEQDQPRKSARLSAREFAGPIEIPDGYELSDQALVKFLCRCGQKVQLDWKQRRDGEPCPRCNEALRPPDVVTDPNVSVLCSCQTTLERGQLICRKCKRELVLPIARTLIVPTRLIKEQAPVSPMAHSTERRAGPDRRFGPDRRIEAEPSTDAERRSGVDRRSGSDRRNSVGRVEKEQALVSPVAPSVLAVPRTCGCCCEPIAATAKKCKHCGEFQDRSMNRTVRRCRFCGDLVVRITKSGTPWWHWVVSIALLPGIVGIVMLISCAVHDGDVKVVWKCRRCGRIGG